MHIGFVMANYPPHSGGVQKHASSLARELRSKGHSVTVFNLEPVGQRTDDGVPVIGLGRHAAVGDIAALPSAGPAWRLARQLQRRQVTHVSVHTRFFPATWLGLLAARRAGLPTVLTEHGGGPVETGSSTVRAATRAIDKSMGHWSWRNADDLIAVSGRSAAFVRRESGRSTRVCGNGIDVDWWSPSGRVVDAPKLVFVGRLVNEKGWRAFLRIAVNTPPSVHCEVLGGGPDLPDLTRAVSELGLADRVRVHGHTTAESVREALSGAVLVNPSTAAEGLQTTLIEGVAAGARVVTYDVGGAQECASVGPATWIAPVGDEAKLQEAALEALGTTWVRPVSLERFEWSSVAEEYLSAFTRAESAVKGA